MQYRLHRPWSALMGTLLCLALSLSGCDQIQKAMDTTNKSSSSAATAPSSGSTTNAASDEAADSDALLNDKLGEYLTCINSLAERVYSSRDRYLSWIADPKVGPTGKESNIYGLYTISPEACQKSIAKARMMQPAIADLDAAASKMDKAISELTPLIKAADNYYEQENYKDDHMAKGKEMHPALMAAFKAYEEAYEPFHTLFTQQNDALGDRHYAKMAKDPEQRLAYLEATMMRDAKKLVKMAKIDTLQELNASAYESGIKALETDIETLEKEATEKGQASKASLLLSNAKSYLKASKDLLRRSRDHKDFNKEFFSKNNPELVEGHPEQIIKKYNSLIDTSNRSQL